MKKSILLATFLTLIGLVVKAQSSDYSFKESYKVAESARLNISNLNGKIKVIGSERNTIEVFFLIKKKNKLIKVSKAEFQEMANDEVALSINHSNNDLEINVESKRSISSWFSNSNYSVSFEVYVPKQTICKLQSTNASIAIKELSTNQNCSTTNGSIKINNVRGDIIARTTNGSINIENIEGIVEAGTSNGSVKIADVIGSTEVDTSNGSIVLTNIKGEVSADTSNSNIKLTNITGNVSADTTNGNIYCNNVEGKVDGDTTNGKVVYNK